jgi:putative aminopeptidase FrvX
MGRLDMAANLKSAQGGPVIGAAQLDLLERLCNASAVSGDEGEVRAIILEQVKPFVDQIKVDAVGNLLITRNGQGESPPREGTRLRVMLAAHMDEVGFMLVENENDGFFRFDTIGGLDARLLMGKPVVIGKDHIPGVIGTKPVHLVNAEERRRSISIESMHIDTGPGSASKVKVGDRATFATRFLTVGPSLRAKALDDRLGVALLIELVKSAPPGIDLLAAFTVQEELGTRGARVAAFAFNPDLAIALDATPANDMPSWDLTPNAVYNTHLGAGPAIYLADAGTLSDPRLVRFVVETAENEQIPYQFRQPGGGGTDAGAIHRQREGIPSISISVPCRYSHTPAGIARQGDWNNTLKLLQTVLAHLTPSVLAAQKE